MVNKVITRMIPECVTETVPVTKMHKVVEPQLCTVTQRIPVDVVRSGRHVRVTRADTGAAGGLRPVRRSDGLRALPPGHDLHRPAGAGHGPTVRFVPETIYVQRTRTKFNPVQETVMCSGEAKSIASRAP